MIDFKDYINYLKKSSKKIIKNKYIFPVIILIVFIRIITIPFIGKLYNYKIGDIVKENIIAKKDIVYIDVKKTEFKKNEFKKKISPIFIYNNNAYEQTFNLFEDFINYVFDLKKNKTKFNDVSSHINNKFKVWISPKSLKVLMSIYNKKYVKQHMQRIYGRISKYLFFDIKRSFLLEYRNYGIVLLREGVENKINPLEMKQVIFKSVKSSLLRKLTYNIYPYINNNYREMLIEVVNKLSIPNVTYDKERTKIRENIILAKIAPVVLNLKKNEIIAREHDRITEQQFEMLKALNKNYKKTDTGDLIGLGLFIIALFMFLGYHIINYYNIDLKKDTKTMSVILFFLFLNLIQAVLLTTVLSEISVYPVGIFIPIGVTSISIAMLFKERFAFFITIVMAYLVLIVTHTDFLSFGMISGAGIISIYKTSKLKKRTDVWKAGFYAFVLLTFSLIISTILTKSSFVNLLTGIGIAFANSILSAIIAVGLIPFFESFLGIPTRFKLLELADTNSPILKRMLIEASGTYTHSIIVGNLAECAAENIGANALLARVGSYYHDIGKIEMPSYFIENQKGIENKHKDLKPSISKSVIISHVKSGVELAKKEGLPKVITDFIEQHHGTSLVKFFYHQALDKKAHDVNREDYRYPGPKPQTKETAILMLADSVEAASKTLKNPTPQRINNLVTEIIRKRFLEGELNESPLTLHDLTTITNSFVKILNSLFHSRVEYPEEENIRLAETEHKKMLVKKRKNNNG